jgi:hypothetical protein
MVLVAAAWVVANALAAASLVLLALDSRASVAQVPAWAAVAMYFVYLPLPTIGALVTLRRPGNAIGPMLLTAGMSIFAYFTSMTYAAYVLVGHPELPGVAIAAWVGAWVFEPYFVVAAVFLPLLYPDSRFISPRWRLIGWFALALTVGQSVASAFGRPVTPIGVPNPLAVSALAPVNILASPIFAVPAILVLIAISGSAVAIRFRRSRGVERLQIKWFIYAIGIALLVIGIGFPLQLTGVIDNSVAFAPMTIAIGLPPLAVGNAILRYRLYDIDRLINGTVVYGVTTGAIAVAFFAGIVVLQAALRPLTGGSEIAVAASTLLCFALFQPVRRRVQSTVDRRFYRARYDAAQILDAFGARLRDEVDLDAVRFDLIDAVQHTVQPAHASVWLRQAKS